MIAVKKLQVDQGLCVNCMDVPATVAVKVSLFSVHLCWPCLTEMGEKIVEFDESLVKDVEVQLGI